MHGQAEGRDQAIRTTFFSAFSIKNVSDNLMDILRNM